MNARERFQRIMRYQPVDRLPVVLLEPFEGYGVEQWVEQGHLPADIRPDEFLGADVIRRLPLSFAPLPPFEPTILYDDEHYYVETDWMGGKVRRDKSAPGMYYGHFDHPVKDLDDWEWYMERFQPSGRVPADIDAVCAELNAAEVPVGLDLFPFFFRLGFYSMGMEPFLTAFYDQPELIHAMFSHWSGLVLDVLRPVLPKVKLDYVTIAEDLAYRGGPLISREIYTEFWLPYQDPIIRELQQHDVGLIAMWTAGDINALLPLMMEHGVDSTWPLESPEMDPYLLRERYGKELRLAGGISKQTLIDGPKAIDRELERLLPIIAEGGYIPAPDDCIPPEVPFGTFRYYIEAVRAIRL